jgi:uncharacterized protein (DUF1778 family)
MTVKRKPGRPAKPADRKLDKMLVLRLTPGESKLVRQAAKASGATLSEWSRLALLTAARAVLGIDEPEA